MRVGELRGAVAIINESKVHVVPWPVHQIGSTVLMIVHSAKMLKPNQRTIVQRSKLFVKVRKKRAGLLCIPRGSLHFVQRFSLLEQSYHSILGNCNRESLVLFSMKENTIFLQYKWSK